MTNVDVERVVASDGAAVEMHVFRAVSRDAPTVLVVPALGVAARHYHKLADALRGAGLNAASIDLRGCGTSSVRASRSVDFGYRTLAESDLGLAIARTRELFPRSPLHLFGHSLGGHLGLLHLALVPGAQIAGILLVASGTPYQRVLRENRLGMSALRVLVPVCIGLLGYFPGDKLGFGGRQARTLMRQWIGVAQSGQFDLSEEGVADVEARLALVTPRVLSISLAGDDYAPQASVLHLLGKLHAADCTHQAYVPESGAAAVDHFRWLRDPGPLVPALVNFVHAAAVREQGATAAGAPAAEGGGAREPGR